SSCGPDLSSLATAPILRSAPLGGESEQSFLLFSRSVSASTQITRLNNHRYSAIIFQKAFAYSLSTLLTKLFGVWSVPRAVASGLWLKNRSLPLAVLTRRLRMFDNLVSKALSTL